MSHWFFGFFFALLGGGAVATVNFLFSRAVLLKKPAVYASFTVVRQLLQIGYLVLLWFLAPKTPWQVTPLLVGGVLGVTGPMFFFTARLSRLAAARPAEAREEEKEEEKNG